MKNPLPDASANPVSPVLTKPSQALVSCRSTIHILREAKCEACWMPLRSAAGFMCLMTRLSSALKSSSRKYDNTLRTDTDNNESWDLKHKTIAVMSAIKNPHTHARRPINRLSLDNSISSSGRMNVWSRFATYNIPVIPREIQRKVSFERVLLLTALQNDIRSWS